MGKIFYRKILEREFFLKWNVEGNDNRNGKILRWIFETSVQNNLRLTHREHILKWILLFGSIAEILSFKQVHLKQIISS